MTGSNFSKTENSDAATESAHKRSGKQVPFFLRAWWLRRFQGFDAVEADFDPSLTGPLWSAFADPLCDMGNLDYFEGY